MTNPPEDYLKTRQVAQALGVSVSTVKRWVDGGVLAATRTVGRHRLIERVEAERFARRQGLRFDAGGTTHAIKLGEPLIEALTTALRRGRSAEARELILTAAAAADSPRLADDLIRPVMERIGRDWETHALDVFQEHRATRAVKFALMELVLAAGRTSPPGPSAPLAIGAAPEGDPYLLPGLLAELTLRELGWDVMNLGVNLPSASLAKAVRAHRPALVWVSVSYLADEEDFLAAYGPFYEAARECGAAVIAGGQALRPELRARMVATGFGDRMAHLAAFARHLRPDAAAPRVRDDRD